MRTITHTIDIAASPEEVWRVLTDLPAYKDWNPFLIEASGAVEVGSRLRIVMRPGSRTMTFSPTVLEVVPQQRLRWLGRLLVRGLFDGEHTLTLEALPDGACRFTQSERFTGLLVPFFGSVLRATDQAFVRMNEALGARVERPVQQGPDVTAAA